ncbi:MAG: hypothetical protein AAF217_10050 [Pseudomonadota bacterium]
MKSFASVVSLSAALVFVAGCTGGTTYGTGSSHEKDTLKSLANIMAVSSDDKDDIDYSSRPDLVMPANKQALPAPVNQADTQADWPVTPEERIETARSAVPEADWRSGDLPTEYLTSKKDGIRNSAETQKNKHVRGARSGGGEQLIEEIRSDAKTGGASEEIKRRRNQLAYSTGVKRKFLTEPPVEYRTPSATAEAGELGITKEEVSEAQKQAAKERKAIEGGVLLPGG